MTRRLPGLVWGLTTLTFGFVAAGIVAYTSTPAGGDGQSLWLALSFVAPIGAFSVIGALICSRQPGNLIGWLLAAIGVLFSLVVACAGVARWGVRTGSLSENLAGWIDVPSNVWVIALGLAGTQLPLRLPDGRLPSPGWRWYSRGTLLLIAVSFVGMSAHTGRIEGAPGTANPVGAAWASPLAGAFVLVILSFGGGLTALVRRYRRSTGHDRLQLRWIRFGGVVFLAVYVVTLPLGGAFAENSAAATAVTSFSQVAFGAVPVGIGYAVLRQRLYDIDVVVNRTLVYGALTATLAGSYLGTVLLLQLVLGGVTGNSGLAVAGSTLAVAALFGPARARIQRGVDRRFYRHKYDAQRTLEAFGARLRDEVSLDRLGIELREVVTETVQPAHVSLWLRQPERAG